jgi:hypothetical protein
MRSDSLSPVWISNRGFAACNSNVIDTMITDLINRKIINRGYKYILVQRLASLQLNSIRIVTERSLTPSHVLLPACSEIGARRRSMSSRSCFLQNEMTGKR